MLTAMGAMMTMVFAEGLLHDEASGSGTWGSHGVCTDSTCTMHCATNPRACDFSIVLIFY